MLLSLFAQIGSSSHAFVNRRWEIPADATTALQTGLECHSQPSLYPAISGLV